MMTPESFLREALRALLLSFFVFNYSFAQQQANIWHFGHMSGLDFSSGAPQQITDSAIDAFEGCASFSDENGNLQFYTNGGGSPPGLIPNGARDGIIWNQNHEVMYNMGENEGGGYSAAQSALIVPKSASANEYYLFTMDQAASLTGTDNRGLSYFVIDMDLNGGLGGVSVANQPVFTPAVECLSIVLHENEQDYWLVTIDQNTNDFVIVPVNSTGVQAPFLQPRQSTDEALVIKASPDGKYLFAAYRLYEFDRSNGTVSLATTLPVSSNYSFSFSPDSRFLYTANADLIGDAIVRYDMTAADIAASMEPVADLEFSFTGGMQIAPDGNIYFLEQPEDLALNAQVGLSAIYCPNETTATFERSLFVFDTEPGTDWVVGLPNFPDFLFDEMLLTDTTTQNLSFCEGTDLLLDAGTSGAAYLWSNGADSPTITINAEGSYSVTVTNACGKTTSIRHFHVEALENGTQTELPQAISLCEGEETTLAGVSNADSYLWSNGETTPEITVAASGSYEVTATFGCGQIISPFLLEVQNVPAVSFKISGTGVPCAGEAVSLTAVAPGNNTYIWSDGSTAASIQAQAGESYTVTVSNSCGTQTASQQIPIADCCNVYVPNAYSPNGDGFNDVFYPFFSGCQISDYRFTIFSRWGEKVFESTTPGEGWDGTFKDKILTGGIYVWQLSYQLNRSEGPSRELRAGDVMVLY